MKHPSTRPCQSPECILQAEDGDDLCVLHSHRDQKERAAIEAAFEDLERAGLIRVHDLYLVGADLSGINLHLKNLQHSNLTGANLRNARLNKVGFDFSTLDEINFEGAILEKCDLRRVKSARDAHWFEVIFNGVQIPSFSRIGLHCVYEDGPDKDLHKAQFVFRLFKEGFKNHGDHDASGLYYEREMDMKRHTGDRVDRAWMTLLWAMAGYGEKPLRSVGVFFVVILGFAFAYLPCELQGPNGEVGSDLAQTLYFSVVTFTSLGYGEISPRGIARLLAGTEALLGVFTISLFVFVFCRRMVR